MSEPIKNRYDFSIFFDVKNGNPNGDPDAGNMPRIDPETNKGIVTDVCIKRKIRNYIQLVKGDQEPWRIYIQQDEPLNRLDAEALSANGVSTDGKDVDKVMKGVKKTNPNLDRDVLNWMCSHYFDIRSFGAVMTTFMKGGLNCGQVRGPVQLGMGESIDQITPQELTITRCAVTTEKDAETKKNTMGVKTMIPYGLYRMNGFINAPLAMKTTGFNDEDVNVLWESIINMFEYDHSAARGEMAVRKLYVFKHDSEYGNAPSHKLFDLIHADRRDGVQIARSFDDYTMTVDDGVPDGVTLTELAG